MTVDAWDEDTAASLASASYPTGAKAFNFAHVTTFTTGGTASTTSGLTSISTGVTVPSVVTKFTLSGKATLATDRYGLGNAVSEQLEEDFFSLTGAFEGEFDVTTWELCLSLALLRLFRLIRPSVTPVALTRLRSVSSFRRARSTVHQRRFPVLVWLVSAARSLCMTLSCLTALPGTDLYRQYRFSGMVVGNAV